MGLEGRWHRDANGTEMPVVRLAEGVGAGEVREVREVRGARAGGPSDPAMREEDDDLDDLECLAVSDQEEGKEK